MLESYDEPMEHLDKINNQYLSNRVKNTKLNKDLNPKEKYATK